MPENNKSALQVLQEMRKERDELSGLIQALEKRLGIASAYQAAETDEASEHLILPQTSSGSLSIGFFHNMSQAAAAEKLLRMNPQKALSTADILEAFRASGMSLNPKNAVTILYTALKRNPKFERVGNKAWGLKEWYPERKRKVFREQEGIDKEPE